MVEDRAGIQREHTKVTDIAPDGIPRLFVAWHLAGKALAVERREVDTHVARRRVNDDTGRATVLRQHVPVGAKSLLDDVLPEPDETPVCRREILEHRDPLPH